MTTAVDIFRQAAQCYRDDPARRGNCLHLGSPGRVVIAGDLHGHRRNLSKILACASAPPKDDRPVLLLQEIIHGPCDAKGRDRSVEVMLRAARAKLADPEKIYHLMGNHALSQITGSEITKDGHGVNEAFLNGIRHGYGDEAPDVYAAVMAFCRSLPLAARFDNSVLAAHSLPSPHRMALGDPEILDREYEEEDFRRGGAAYEWTWGRDQTPEQLDALAERLGVAFFVLAHRHIEDGSMLIPRRAICINSDGPGGVIFEFAPDETITPETALRHVRKIDSL